MKNKHYIKKIDKSLFLTMLLVFIALYSFTQKPFKSKILDTSVALEKNVSDTLYPESFLTGTLTLDTAMAGGYVCGTNAYNDVAKAQIYDIPQQYSYFVKGIGLHIGDLVVLDTAAYLTVALHAIDAPGYSNNGFEQHVAPGYVFSEMTVPASVLINNHLNIIYFTNDVFVSDAYALGVNFSDFSDNVVGLISTTDGDAGGTERAWEKMADGFWYAMLKSWGWDADMGIVSIIDGTTAQVHNAQIDEASVLLYPSVLSSGSVFLDLKNAEINVLEVDLFDVQGRHIKNNVFCVKDCLQDTYEISLNDLSRGTYFVRIKAEESILIKKIIKL